MEIIGTIPGRGCSWEVMFKNVLKSQYKHRLLKTIELSGFYTDGVCYSLLRDNERAEVNKAHWDAVVVDEVYAKSKPLDVKKALPKYLTAKVKTANYAGSKNDIHIVHLHGPEELEAYVLLDQFNTLLARHPETEWFFPWNPAKPIVLLKQGTFDAGRLVAAIATLKIPKKPGMVSKKNWVRTRGQRGWVYKSYQIEEK